MKGGLVPVYPNYQGRGGLRGLLRGYDPAIAGANTNLSDIIASQGRTDPMAFNREVAAIGRGTQNLQDYYRGLGASEGFGQGGIFGALQGAAGIGGIEAQANAQARENALAEERKREDIEMLYRTLIAARLQRRALNIQKYLGELQARSRGGGLSAGGALSGLSGTLQALGLGGGGGGGMGGDTQANWYGYPASGGGYNL